MDIEMDAMRPGMTVENTLQTNGMLLDDEWCKFLHEKRFLVGLSLDGPREMHDAYRRDKAGNSVFDKVVAAAHLMQKHQVEFNIFCTVNAVNSQHPLELYRFFRDELKTPYLQSIPIVEKEEGRGTGGEAGRRDQCSAEPPAAAGHSDMRTAGAVPVILRSSFRPSPLDPRPSAVLTQAEADGVKITDRSVQPEQYGWFLFTCHGECPKNRVLITADGELNLNWLCAGLKAFYEHTEQPMKEMARLLKSGHYADEIMKAANP